MTQQRKQECTTETADKIIDTLTQAFRALRYKELNRLVTYAKTNKTIFCGKGSSEDWRDHLGNPWPVLIACPRVGQDPLDRSNDADTVARYEILGRVTIPMSTTARKTGGYLLALENASQYDVKVAISRAELYIGHK